MTRRSRAEQAVPTPSRAQQGARRWLLFVHQLPSTPSNLRVRTWRRLQQLGAIPIKQAVYVLPDSPGAREDFEWLKSEVKGAGGDASVFAADHIDAWSEDAVVEEFRRSRQEAYEALAREIENVMRRAGAARRPAAPAHPPRADSWTSFDKALQQLRASTSSAAPGGIASSSCSNSSTSGSRLPDVHQLNPRVAMLQTQRPIKDVSGSRGPGPVSIAWLRPG